MVTKKVIPKSKPKIKLDTIKEDKIQLEFLKETHNITSVNYDINLYPLKQKIKKFISHKTKFEISWKKYCEICEKINMENIKCLMKVILR
jgi:hypothetical protein